MKKISRILALTLILSSLLSAFPFAFAATHQTGSERFEGVSKSEKDAEKVEEIYEELIYRVYEFDEDIMLPNLEDMNDYEDIKIKYVQSKHGFAKGQSLYEEPDGKIRWSAKDGAMVMVYAKYKDYSFVELMMNEEEPEGTIAWIPTTYLVSKWSASTSVDRANRYGG